MSNDYNDLNRINNELSRFWPGWTAVRLLGRGAFGAVYEIRRVIRSNVECAAMKVMSVPADEAELQQLRFRGMSIDSIDDYYENYVDNIQNEIIIMQNLVGNSYLVSYEDYAIRKRYNVGWDIYIRMELLIGLTDYMSQYPLSEQSILKLGMDVALGLDSCHKKGIIHRDVKPQNIFLSRGGNFKLGDFGVSRWAPGSQDILSFKGTLSYMAPEVYRMESTDARSDIYSVGMVLYECLNDNRQPFVPENFTPLDLETSRQRRLAGEKLPKPIKGSGKLKKIVLKALSPELENRYQTAEELYNELAYLYKPGQDAEFAVNFRAYQWFNSNEYKGANQQAHKNANNAAQENHRSTAPETEILGGKQESRKNGNQVKDAQKSANKPVRYTVQITPEEARSGCTKMIIHRGRQIAVIIKAGYKKGSINVSFGGETILVDPVIKEKKRYTVMLTPEEAYYGCTKMINYRGRQVAVIIEPGLVEKSTRVSFEGEEFFVDSVIKYW